MKKAPFVLVIVLAALVVSNGDINWHGEGAVDPDLVSAGVRRALNADQDLAIVSNFWTIWKTGCLLPASNFSII